MDKELQNRLLELTRNTEQYYSLLRQYRSLVSKEINLVSGVALHKSMVQKLDSQIKVLNDYMFDNYQKTISDLQEYSDRNNIRLNSISEYRKIQSYGKKIESIQIPSRPR
jgi:hypothetical protein